MLNVFCIGSAARKSLTEPGMLHLKMFIERMQLSLGVANALNKFVGQRTTEPALPHIDKLDKHGIELASLLFRKPEFVPELVDHLSVRGHQALVELRVVVFDESLELRKTSSCESLGIGACLNAF